MRKIYLLLACAVLTTCILIATKNQQNDNLIYASTDAEGEGEEEGYDGPALRDQLEFDKIKDPSLGYVPYDRLINAMDVTEQLKNQSSGYRLNSALLWVERGPNYDSLGPSNGNTRGGGGYTSGRMRAVLIDTLNDPTGNTVFVGGVAGGLWKTTNFMNAVPNWSVINDYFDNLAISSMCQDPTSPNIMYFTTGEPTSNADAVLGAGVWKSTDGGNNWTRLPGMNNYIRSFKIMCDAAGNVYIAARPTTTPVAQSNSLMRSKDKGVTWQNITPTGLTSNAVCTDIEISSTGKLHASFGYLGTIVNHRYTNDPANVTPAGWSAGTGIRSGNTPSAIRFEMAALADTIYGYTVNTGYNVDSIYKSVDGGATWVKQNTASLQSGILSGQGWYNATLAINPSNSSEIILGGLDAYRSINSGATASRITFWVTTAPYVHADHHFLQWWNIAGESRIVLGSDGGIFVSRNGGVTWSDRNRNLSIKQFYSASIHPTAGSNYLLAGAQDNGTHALSNPGLSYSMEVTGGDGCFTHINQLNPQVQFGSYVYNQYRRSTNGGATWTSLNFSGSAGMFVNPFDYDDAKNIMYASWGSSVMFRWPNAHTGTTANTLTLTGLGTPSTFKVSPTTPERLFIGSSSGRVYRLENADTVTAATVASRTTNITGAGWPTGFVSCVNTGTNDSTLVVVFSNYGVNNVWYSTNAGTSWTAIDGNLPDMPVRWALFVPGKNDQLILATEAGIYTTDAVNGASTQWSPNPGFPTVRVDQLKIRTSDNTIVAATHGRGLFTAQVPTTSAPQINFSTANTVTLEDNTSMLNCRGYKDYTVNVGIVNAPTGDATVTFDVSAGNTATRGVDFDFTTNGSFTSPSTQLLFANGATAVKPITIRIYDDAQVESPESFVVTFAITGTTNAVAGTNMHTVSIGDNDAVPHTSQNITASFGSNNTSLTQPFRGQFSDARTQIVYLASELQAAGFKAGNITSLAFNVVAKNSTAPFTGFNIKMKNTATSTLNGGAFEAGATLVYGPVNYSTVAGTNTFSLTTPFFWDGTSNVMLDICYDNATGTATDNVAGTSGLARCHFDRVDNTAGCSLPNASFIFTGGARPDITFSITTAQTTIATAVNTTKTEYLTSNNDLYYYSSNGEIIAKVKNLSAHNYGCAQVIVDRAGTGTSQFWNTNTANYLMNKTFRIVPATNNPAGSYEVTFYYTAAEKAGWEAATGQSWNNIMLVKVPSQISNVTPLNAQPDGPGTVQVVAPVHGTFGTGYTLTYTFNNGFSGFGAGVPGRMNTLLTLTGAVQNNTIGLSWTTSAEINSSSFDIEKSYNGTDFRVIGTATASGTKLSPTNYTFTDNEQVEINYYRIRMHHSDGLVLLSNTIMVRNDNAQQHLFVLTNPFNNDIRVRFGRVPRTAMLFSLYDATGKLIKRYQTNPGSGNLVNYNIKTEAIAAAGIYILEVQVDGQKYTARVMKR